VALLHADRPALLDGALRGGRLTRAWLGGLELEPHGTAVEGVAPRGASEAVLLEEDPARRAHEVLDRAFGPVRALGGQRAGQVARVFCHERRLSAFTDALLEALDARPLEGGCRPFVDGLEGRIARLVRLGLDEGATLVRGALDGRPGFRGGSRDASLWPRIFTNVEPGMALARAQEPAPVLSLVRVADDDTAEAAARRADGA
jgi:acyl-CoA reductase-like NAD-dependent aldehyde dehydrogenase